MTAVALTLGAGAAVPVSPVGEACLDVVAPGLESSAREHGLRSVGHVVKETLEAEMGTLRSRHEVVTLTGRGAEVSFEVKRPAADRALLLEIEEVHNRRPDAFGYRVTADGEAIYFRSYQEYGAGPNHYFVHIPAAQASGSGSVRIALRSEGGAPFSIGRVWAYDDFFNRVARPEGMFRPMGLVIPHERMTNASQRAAYAGLRNYAPVGLLGFAAYGFGNADEQRAHWERLLDMSAETGLDVLLLSNGTGWGGMPSGPDGLGGYFSDLRYSLLQYDGPSGEYRPSWPGMWGPFSTPTLRDPWLNAFLERRFAKIFGGLRERIDRHEASGAAVKPSLVREFAPVSGEVSNFNVETAKAEGLTLDPSDGLSREERLWMHRDAARAWQDFADSTVRAIGRDSVVVDRGIVRLPGEQMLDRLYSHPDFLGTWPVNDARWCGGQMGMVEGLWSSGEMGQGYDYRDVAMYDYLRARGRLSMINMERTILKDNFSVLKNHFARGFHFVCLFNAYDDDAALVRSMDGIDDEPAPPAVHREPVLLDVSVAGALSAGPPERIVALDNLAVHHDLRLAVREVSRPGRVVYRLDNLGEPFGSGLNLHLDGRISPGAGNRIVLLGGPSPDQLREVAVLGRDDLPCPDHWTPWMTSETSVDLGESMLGRNEWYLGMEFHATAAPDEAFLLGFRIGSKWPWRGGHVGGEPFTMAENRAMQLWVQERALAERWLAAYRQLGGNDEVLGRASDLFARGWYASAYRLLSGEASLALPARFVIRGHGRLGRHPVEIRMDREDASAGVILHALNERGADIEFIPLDPSNVTVRVTLPERPDRASWRMEPGPSNRYRFMTMEAGTTAAPATFEVSLAPEERTHRALSARLSARFLGRDENGIRVDVHDLDLMEDDEHLMLPVAPDATFTRAPHHLAREGSDDGQPQPMDRVDVTLDEQGRVQSITAVYGLDRGRIKAFYPPSPMGKVSNGVIELDNGRRYELDFSKIHGTRFDTVAMQGLNLNYELRALREAIKPGQLVELTYCPYHAPDRLPRVHAVKQPRIVLLERDFTATTGDEWRADALRVDGVDVVPHKPEPNYLYKVVKRLMRPVEAFKPGHVIYRFEQDSPFGETAVEFSARAFEDSSRVTFYASADGENWIRCGQFDNTWQNNISQVLDDLPWQFVDLSPVAKGQQQFFLKMELVVHEADGRYCVARVRVATEKQGDD